MKTCSFEMQLVSSTWGAHALFCREETRFAKRSLAKVMARALPIALLCIVASLLSRSLKCLKTSTFHDEPARCRKGVETGYWLLLGRDSVTLVGTGGSTNISISKPPSGENAS